MIIIVIIVITIMRITIIISGSNRTCEMAVWILRVE